MFFTALALLNYVAFEKPTNFTRDVKETAHVLWMDNFSKNLAWTIPQLGEGAYKSCMWTGFAIKQFIHDQELDMKLKIDVATGDVIPAMPDNPFRYQKQFMRKYQTVEGDEGMLGFDTSKVVMWQVNNVPLKPKTANAPLRYHDALKITESLHNFYPEKLVDLNPASNEHSMKLFKSVLDELHADEAAGSPAVYKAMTLDVAIYDQALKVDS